MPILGIGIGLLIVFVLSVIRQAALNYASLGRELAKNNIDNEIDSLLENDTEPYDGSDNDSENL